MTRAKISAHFAAAEFDCHNGAEWPPAARRALEWWAAVWGEPMREAFGPIRVTSGYRTTSYNQGVGGAPGSFHVYTLRYGPTARAANGVGVAADVVPSRGAPATWQRWATDRGLSLRARRAEVAGIQTAGRLAAVAYPQSGFIHLDTGPFRTWVG